MSTLSHEKKGRLLMLLNILQEHSNKDKGLTQQEIINYLKEEYDVNVERKAIADDITFLMELSEMFPERFDFEIESNRSSGISMVNRKFDDSELQLLIDAVIASKNITEKQTKELCNRIASLSDESFSSNISRVSVLKDISKIKTPSLFLNIDILTEAIQKKQKVKIEYGKYEMDMKLHQTSTYEISPYRLVFHNQKYYVIGYREDVSNMSATRIDHIIKAEIIPGPKKSSSAQGSVYKDIKTIKGYENGFDINKLATMPYLFFGDTERIVFMINEAMLDDCIEWFGKNATITKKTGKEEGGKTSYEYQVEVRSTLMSMEYWLMQYINGVKIISTAELKNKVKQNLEKALKNL